MREKRNTRSREKVGFFGEAEFCIFHIQKYVFLSTNWRGKTFILTDKFNLVLLYMSVIHLSMSIHPSTLLTLPNHRIHSSIHPSKQATTNQPGNQPIFTEGLCCKRLEIKI